MSVNIFEDGKLKKIAGNSAGGGVNSSENVVVFESGDNLSPEEPADIPLIKSGEPHKSLFGKLSNVAKNTRYLLKMLGATDISSIADGTLTGAANEINEWKKKMVVLGRFKMGSLVNRQYITITVPDDSYRYGVVLLVSTSGSAIFEWNGNYSKKTVIAKNESEVSYDLSGRVFTINTGYKYSHGFFVIAGGLENGEVVVSS